jgi:hypothetical protein
MQDHDAIQGLSPQIWNLLAKFYEVNSETWLLRMKTSLGRNVIVIWKRGDCLSEGNETYDETLRTVLIVVALVDCTSLRKELEITITLLCSASNKYRSVEGMC